VHFHGKSIRGILDPGSRPVSRDLAGMMNATQSL
jgi:hypothetical protein